MNKLIFLGTGSTNNLERQMTSLLFVTEKKNFLIDCGDGMGTVRNIVASGIDPLSIYDVFITHRHADHITGMAHFLFVRLIRDQKAKIRIFGPREALHVIEKVAFLTHDYLKMNRHRIAFISVSQSETIKLAPGVTVQVGRVNGPKHVPTYGYKIMMNKQTVVFSADMHPSPGFNKFVKNADILIHECFGLDRDKPVFIKFGHSSAKDAGECAQKAGVKQLILTHLQESHVVSPEDLAAEARQYFNGEIKTAHDLMEITF